MAVLSRSQLSDYCLRQLGAPVIRINVAPEQIEDRIDDALELFQEMHYDGTEEVWAAKVIDATDVSNGYITLPDDVLIVTELGTTTSADVTGAETQFSARYMIGSSLFNPYSVFGSSDLIDYYLVTTSFNEIENMMTSIPTFEFVRHANKLHINSGVLVEGCYIYFKCFKIIDPETNAKIYNDRWLKQYATQLIKKQWGSNLSKHNNIQLLGGVTTNGEQLYDQAVTDIEKLLEELESKYQEPTDFFVI
jgi:hypothetical protein